MELLTSLTWALADNNSRVLAIALMMIAAKNDNKIPANPDYVKRVAYLHDLPDFSQLIHLEFIEFIDDSGKVVTDASNLLAGCKQTVQIARPEKETEKETEGETEAEKEKPSRRVAPCDIRFSECVEILNRYHGKFVHKTRFDVWFGNRGGKQLKNLLKAEPQLDVPTFERSVGARARSPGIDHEELVYKWVFHVIGNGRGNGNGQIRPVSKADERERRIIEQAQKYAGYQPAGAVDSQSAGTLALSGDGGDGVRGLAGNPEFISPERDPSGAGSNHAHAAKAGRS